MDEIKAYPFEDGTCSRCGWPDSACYEIYSRKYCEECALEALEAKGWAYDDAQQILEESLPE